MLQSEDSLPTSSGAATAIATVASTASHETTEEEEVRMRKLVGINPKKVLPPSDETHSPIELSLSDTPSTIDSSVSVELTDGSPLLLQLVLFLLVLSGILHLLIRYDDMRSAGVTVAMDAITSDMVICRK